MNRKPTSILKLAVVVGGAIISLAGTLNAQSENQRSDTDIADNPHLRRATSSSSSGSSNLSDKDKNFVANASGAGTQEVADGKVAESRGNAEVKKIGARMVADHSKANKELTSIAKNKGAAVSEAKARGWAGSDFDARYLATLEADHKKDIQTFEKEASSGNDNDLKSFAARTLPTLKEHLAMIKDARKKMK